MILIFLLFISLENWPNLSNSFEIESWGNSAHGNDRISLLVYLFYNSQSC